LKRTVNALSKSLAIGRLDHLKFGIRRGLVKGVEHVFVAKHVACRLAQVADRAAEGSRAHPTVECAGARILRQGWRSVGSGYEEALPQFLLHIVHQLTGHAVARKNRDDVGPKRALKRSNGAIVAVQTRGNQIEVRRQRADRRGRKGCSNAFQAS
jgi:hypothetical protein